MEPDQCLQVMTTAGSREEADRIATALVDSRLAACVQVAGPVTSRYWWRGTVETSSEWLCVAKTAASRYGDVEAAIREVHSYNVPEILAIPVAAASRAYVDWMAGEIR